MPILGIFASANQSRYISTTAYESIQTYTLSSSQSSISFTSIPSNYSHLQIRVTARTDFGLPWDGCKINFNSDFSNSYSWHEVGGNGATALIQKNSTDAAIYAYYIPGNGANNNIFGASVIDILDYANTSKYKTLRNLNGTDNNGSGYIMFGSGSWQKTSAITSIQLDQSDGSNFLANSQFALYGIKGA